MKNMKRREFIMLAIAAAPLVAVPFWLRRSKRDAPNAESNENHSHHHREEAPETTAADFDDDRSPAQVKKVVVRHEASSPEAKKHLESYAKAVAKMKTIKRDGKTGNSWEAQAYIHQDYCPHGGWAFFPWHREYLARFEDIIREMSGDPDFALPYWDWTKNPDIPAAFLTGALTSGQSGDQSRNSSAKNAIKSQVTQYTQQKIIDRILGTQDFETFMGAPNSSGSAEIGPHNGVHIVLGGQGSPMGEFLSPLDPVFWLHHCNVDRIWALWQEKYPEWRNVKQIEKTASGWLTIPVTGFYDKKGDKIDDKNKSKARFAHHVIDTKKLGYVYSGTKDAQNLGPAAMSTDRRPSAEGKLFRTETRGFTRDGIKATIDAGTEAVDITFPGFREGGKVDSYTDGYMAYLAKKPIDRNDYKNFIFRLRVKNFPKLEKNSSVEISFLPNGTGEGKKTVFLTHYCFFGKATGDAGGEFVPEFRLDYAQLMKALNQLDKTLVAHPKETSFRVEVIKNGKKSKLTDFNFNDVEFSLTVLERVYDA